MTAWDVLDKLITSFSPIVMVLILMAILAAVVTFIVGFGRHGLNFLKYGFQQKEMGDLSKKLDEFRAEFKGELEEFRSEFRGELEIIKTNHFGHLKSFLCELTSILLDKSIINNTDKARLDNQLRDM